MEKEDNSLCTRTKFTHTVLHRTLSLSLPEIQICNPSRLDAPGEPEQKVALSSWPSYVDLSQWRNKGKEQELKHKDKTMSPMPTSGSQSFEVNKEQNSKHNQSNGVPHLPTFSAESSSSNSEPERSAFYLTDGDGEKSSKVRQKSKSGPLTKLVAGINHSGFDFQMPSSVAIPKFHNSKARIQFPLFQRSNSLANCEIKSTVSSTALSKESNLERSDNKKLSSPIPCTACGKEDETVDIRKMLSKHSDKLRLRKDHKWTRYFNHSRGKVSAVDAIEECRIDLSELYLGDRFAIGSNSRLYHGSYKSQSVAVKITILPDDDEDDDLAKRVRLEKQFAGEIALLTNLHHRNVIKLVGAFKDPPSLCILTEYLSGGSLRAFLHKPENKKLPLPKLVELSLGIARGLEYIHSKGIVHRDLKPENILFDEDFCVKMADFGIACEETYCDVLADDPGTYRFMAPEMIKRKPHGRKVDVYSFGLVLWEMLTGSVPFEDMIPYQAAFAVVDKNLRPPIPADCPPPMRILIEQCWTLHPNKRPEFSQIVNVLEHFEAALLKDGTLNSITDTSSHESHSRWFHSHSHNRSQKLKSSATGVTHKTMPKLL